MPVDFAYYGCVIEGLVGSIKPDTSEGEAPELPRYKARRGPGSTAEVDFWTSRDVREVVRSHLNYVVADTAKWEQSAAYVVDTHPLVEAFVKNAGWVCHPLSAHGRYTTTSPTSSCA